MQLDKFTIKAQEALHHAQRLAEQHGHQEVDVVHLALALVEQEDGVVRPLLERVGVAPARFEQKLREGLAARPQVSGEAAERYLGRSLKAVLDRAAATARDMKDEYVSTEHLFLACVEKADTEVGRAAADLGIRHRWPAGRPAAGEGSPPGDRSFARRQVRDAAEVRPRSHRGRRRRANSTR